jgi:hypothetical protein
MAFTWVTPQVGDITAVTATSPLTGGGTSGDVTIGIQSGSTTQSGAIQLTDSTSSTSTTTAATPNSVKTSYDLANAAITKSTVTNAGDIIYRNATVPTRLGIGTAGQVLQVNSGATAPEWATASSGGMTLLSTTSLSGSSVTVSSISGSYTDLRIIVKAAYGSSDSDLFVRVNGDTGSNYSYYNMGISDTSAANAYSDSATSAQIGFITSSSTYDKKTDIVFDLPRYTDTSNFFAIATSSVYAFSGRRQIQSFFRNNNSAAITSFTIFSSSGTFTAGTLYIYGVK